MQEKQSDFTFFTEIVSKYLFIAKSISRTTFINIFRIISKIKKYIIIIGIIITTGYIFTIIIESINFIYYKENLERNLLENYNLNVNIKGDIKLSLFPNVHFTVNNADIKYNSKLLLTAENIKFFIPITSIFSKKIVNKITNISLDNGSIYADNYLRYFNDILKIQDHISTNKIIFENFKIISSNNINDNNYAKYINTNIKILTILYNKDEILLNASIFYHDILEKIAFKMSGMLKDMQNITLSVVGEDMILKTNINNVQIKNGKITNFNGNTTVKINDLNLFIRYFLDNDKLITYLKNNIVFKKDIININYNLNMIDEIMSVTDFEIKSPYLKNLNSIINLDKKDIIESNIILNADYLDIDGLLIDNYLKTSSPQKLYNVLRQSVFHNFNILNIKIKEDFIGSLYINCNKIKLFGENLNNLNIVINSLPDAISVNNFSFDMPGKSIFKTNGLIISNKIDIPKYNGTILFKSLNPTDFFKWFKISDSLEDFKKKSVDFIIFNSDVIMLPYHMSFSNLNLALNSESIIGGNLWFVKESTNNIASYAYFFGDILNLNIFNLSDKFDHYLSALYEANYDKSGDKYYELTDDHMWLRRLNGNNHLKLNFEKLIFKNKEFNKFYASIYFKTNNINVQEISLDSDILSLNANASFSIPLFKPHIQINVDFSKIKLDEISNLFPSIESMYAQFKKNNESASKKIQPENFNFFSTAQYDGIIKLHARDIFIKNYKLNNTDALFRWSNGTLTLEKLNTGLFQGVIDAIGEVYIMDFNPQFYFKINTSNIEPKNVLYNMVGFDKMQGYMSSSSILQSIGGNMADLKKYMNGSGSFICKKIQWTGFDLDKVIEAIDDKTEPTTNKVSRMDYYSQYGSTYFDEINGKFFINNNVISIQDVILKNNRISGAFGANYDYINNNIKSNLNISFIPIDAYNSLKISMKSEGALNDTKTKVDMEDLYRYIGYNKDNNITKVNKDNAQLLRNRLMEFN